MKLHLLCSCLLESYFGELNRGWLFCTLRNQIPCVHCRNDNAEYPPMHACRRSTRRTGWLIFASCKRTCLHFSLFSPLYSFFSAFPNYCLFLLTVWESQQDHVILRLFSCFAKGNRTNESALGPRSVLIQSISVFVVVGRYSQNIPAGMNSNKVLKET